MVDETACLSTNGPCVARSYAAFQQNMEGLECVVAFVPCFRAQHFGFCLVGAHARCFVILVLLAHRIVRPVLGLVHLTAANHSCNHCPAKKSVCASSESLKLFFVRLLFIFLVDIVENKKCGNSGAGGPE